MQQKENINKGNQFQFFFITEIVKSNWLKLNEDLLRSPNALFPAPQFNKITFFPNRGAHYVIDFDETNHRKLQILFT